MMLHVEVCDGRLMFCPDLGSEEASMAAWTSLTREQKKIAGARVRQGLRRLGLVVSNKATRASFYVDVKF